MKQIKTAIFILFDSSFFKSKLENSHVSFLAREHKPTKIVHLNISPGPISIHQ
jgi:hypothetical protein